MRRRWKDIKKLLDEYGITNDGLHKALGGLIEYCDDVIDNMNNATLISSGIALTAWVFGPPGLAVTLVSGILAIGLGLDSRMWDHWRDILWSLRELVDED
jgi:hypothetical protein